MQGWFNMKKIMLMLYILLIKDKTKWVSQPCDIEKVYDKIQHPFIKTVTSPKKTRNR